MRQWIFLLPLLSFAQVTQPQAIGVLSRFPLPSPQEIADLESKVKVNPDDLDSRTRLLHFYSEALPFAPRDPLRLRRLEHILYLVDHHPENAASRAPFAFV